MRDLADAAEISTLPQDETPRWQCDPAHQHLAVDGQGLLAAASQTPQTATNG